jgi:hypothetical protein
MVRPKIRISGLMALVAVFALGIWGEQMRQRRAYCLRKSREHRTKLLMTSFHMQHAPMATEAEKELRKTYPHAAWHLTVSDAYLRCARRPWLPVPLEPEEPFAFPPGQVTPP